MSSRYENRRVVINDNKLYREVLEDKGISFIKQFNTSTLPKITPEQIQLLDLIPHVWGVGDRFYKLAHRAYGDTSMWWVIAWFNQKPTDHHVNVGDPIYIPAPLDKLLSMIG